MKSFSIMKKSVFISIVTIIGLSFIGIFTYFSISKIENKYHHAQEVSQKQNHLKSMLCGGLVFNSASGVVYENPKNGKTVIAAIDPSTMLQVTGRDDLKEFSDQVGQKLNSALEKV